MQVDVDRKNDRAHGLVGRRIDFRSGGEAARFRSRRRQQLGTAARISTLCLRRRQPRQRHGCGRQNEKPFVHRIAQPEILNAAIAAMLTRSESFADSGTICTDLSNPTRSGPITVAPPSSCSILVEIEAEWNAGMIRTFATFVSRLNG